LSGHFRTGKYSAAFPNPKQPCINLCFPQSGLNLGTWKASLLIVADPGSIGVKETEAPLVHLDMVPRGLRDQPDAAPEHDDEDNLLSVSKAISPALSP